jgi:vancomycin resistance protein YoaR
MAQIARDNVHSGPGVHARRDDIIRPPEARRYFPVREAQRHLQRKERRWAPVLYAVFLVGAFAIFCGAYTSYAFSKYRNEILPGVRVDTVQLSGMSSQQATIAIYNQLGAMYYKPVRLVYKTEWTWQPRKEEIGISYLVASTVKAAMLVGRHESFPEQLLDRMPFHPSHSVPLLYQLDQTKLAAYLKDKVAPKVRRPLINAALNVQNDHVVLLPSRPGVRMDLRNTENAVTSGLGYLTRQTRTVSVDHTVPIVNDVAATAVRDRVERFLSRTPTIRIGKLVIATRRSDFAPMISFQDVINPHAPAIKMVVDSGKVHSYIAQLASRVDRQAANARMRFTGGHVQVISPRVTGRTLDQTAAYTALIKVIRNLRPGKHLAFTVTTIQPSIDLSNPASLGISRLLSTGRTSFAGAGDTRLNDISAIAQQLNGRLLPPGQDISFNLLVGSGWDPRVYLDQETSSGGQVVPGSGGAMQQVATTFLRALYGAGLKLEERHAHTHRLSWYEPPVGYDAVVAPDRNWDLRFMNNTGKYLLLETRVEPIRQELYIYVFGPRLGWSVAVDKFGKVTKTVPHGRTVTKVDPTLAAGEQKQTQFAHDGATTDVQRTITYPNGKVTVDDITTVYEPWDAVILVGAQTPQGSQSQPKTTPKKKPTPIPTEGSLPVPTPSPTP